MAKVKQGENSMQKLLLNQGAFDRFYGSSRLIVMSIGIYKTLSGLLPEALDVLLLDKTGKIFEPNDQINTTTNFLQPIGAPIGLLGFIVDRRMTECADCWSNWWAAQTGRAGLPVATVRKSRTAAMQCLMDLVLAKADNNSKAAAGIQTDLAVLRRDFERSLIQLEKARRLIRGIGYDTRYSTVSVPVGSKTVGPDKLAGPLDPFVVRFGLPTDAAGVQGISLHFDVPKGSRAEGCLTVRLLRSVDSLVLGSAELLFSEIDPGWAYLALDRGLVRSFGDAELVLEWVVNKKGSIPTVSLTDAPLNRCGSISEDGYGAKGALGDTLLALKIWSGFSPGELAEGHDFFQSPMEYRRRPICKLMGAATVVSSSEPADSILSQDPAAGWVQTHLHNSGPVGLVFEEMVPAAAQSLTITCETAHASAPTCLYLVAAGGPAVMQPEYMAQLIDKAKLGGSGKGLESEANVAWQAQIVTPGSQQQLTIDLSSLAKEAPAHNLGMVVVSVSGDTAEYGWCRWHDVSVALNTIKGHSTVTRSLAEANEPLLRMRSIKFPEIGDQIEYLAGRSKLQTLADKLGFSPMIVPDDFGSLQTHPINEGVSAAIYRSGAAAGTTLVACDIETAHERAPDFLYVLALVKADTVDKYEMFQEFINALASKEFFATRGYDKDQEIHYSARRLPALKVDSVSIDLNAPLEQDHDIIVAALPVSDVISYGWCRWLSLSVASVVDLQPQFDLGSTEQ